MKETTYGYSWRKKPGVNPALDSAMMNAGRNGRVRARIVRPDWVLDYEFGGTGGRYRVRTESSAWQMRRAWTVHLYPPHTVFWEDKRRAEEWLDSCWMLFTDRRKDLQSLHHPGGYARFLDRQERIGQLIRRAAEIGKRRGEEGFWEAQAVLCEALDTLAGARLGPDGIYEIERAASTSGMSVLVNSVNAYLKEHLTEKILLEDIARHLNTSVSSLAHRYKQAAGNSPKAVLTRLRVESAKALLLKGYPLRAVATQVGFADMFHLSKTFKRLEGIPPSVFTRTLHHN